jgi:hypothetical protein
LVNHTGSQLLLMAAAVKHVWAITIQRRLAAGKHCLGAHTLLHHNLVLSAGTSSNHWQALGMAPSLQHVLLCFSAAADAPS